MVNEPITTMYKQHNTIHLGLLCVRKYITTVLYLHKLFYITCAVLYSACNTLTDDNIDEHHSHRIIHFIAAVTTSF